MEEIKRRHFLMGSAAAASISSSLAADNKKTSANDKVTVAMIGVGGRGRSLLRRFTSRPDVDIACLCDVDSSKFEQALEHLDDVGRPEPSLEQDFRNVLDRRDIDAVVIATNLHWQALATIMSCQAGKDVYVEKPASQYALEAKMAAEAARKYSRVVQVGFQNRSAPYVDKAIDCVHSGNLGDIHLVRVSEMVRTRVRRDPSGKIMPAKGPSETPPSHLDWDLFCGPAPHVKYSPGRWWAHLFNYGTGGIFSDGCHQIDVARALIGQDYPKTVTCGGGVFAVKDGRDIPDTQLATFEFDNLTFVIEGTQWAQYMYKTPGPIRDGDRFPDWRFNSTKVELLGTEAMMTFGRQGGGWQVHDLDRNLISSEYGRQATAEHIANFIDCIRTRKRPNADIEEGHRSTLLCHLANASYRAGGIKLEYDPEKVEFVGNPEASKFLRRQHQRDPWKLPKTV